MIAIGADHRGYNLKEQIKTYLEENNIKYIDCGTYSEDIAHYPLIAAKVAEKVQKGEAESGIVICGSGGGVTIVANKYRGIRCQCCDSEKEATEAKAHNNINIIALPADKIDINVAVQAIRAWLATETFEGRYLDRRNMIKDIENNNMK